MENVTKNTLTLARVVKTLEEANSIIDQINELDLVLVTSEDNSLYIKRDGNFEKFEPVSNKLRTSNNLIIKFKTHEEFIENFNNVPDDSSVFVHESNAIWHKDPDTKMFKRLGTPEELGMKIYL